MIELDNRQRDHAAEPDGRGRPEARRRRLRELPAAAHRFTEQARKLRGDGRRHAPPRSGPDQRA